MKFIVLMSLLVSQSLFAGRFEFHQNQQYPNRSVLLDTQTGKMWTPTCFTEQKDGECAVKAWSSVDVVGVNITEEAVWKAAELHNKNSATKK